MKEKNKSNRSAYINAAAIILAAFIGVGGVIYSTIRNTKTTVKEKPTSVIINKDSLTSFSINRNITLDEGDFIILADNFNYKIKIRLNSIEKLKNDSEFEADSELYAEINVDRGGGIVYGGNRTIMKSVNTYFVPTIKYNEEERNSIYYYYLEGKSFTFFQLFVQNINPIKHQVIMKVFFLNRDIK